MSRSEFSTKVKLAAWDRCKGYCEKCTAKLYPGKFQYDHRIPDGLRGEPTLENCQVLCSACHSVKTYTQDRPPMTKADNIKKRHLGIRTKRGFRKPPEGYKYNWSSGRMEKVDG